MEVTRQAHPLLLGSALLPYCRPIDGRAGKAAGLPPRFWHDCATPGCSCHSPVTAIAAPQITKHNFLVMDVKDIPRVIKEAFYLARTGRPGEPLLLGSASCQGRSPLAWTEPVSNGRACVHHDAAACNQWSSAAQLHLP